MLEKVKFTARDGVLVFRKTLQETGEKKHGQIAGDRVGGYNGDRRPFNPA